MPVSRNQGIAATRNVIHQRIWRRDRRIALIEPLYDKRRIPFIKRNRDGVQERFRVRESVG